MGIRVKNNLMKIYLLNDRIFVKDIREAYSQLKDGAEEQKQCSESSLTRENVEGKSSPVGVTKPEKQDYTNDNLTLEVKLYRAQVRTVFGLQVLGSLTLPSVAHVSCLTLVFYKM